MSGVPISPAELDRLEVVYENARFTENLSRFDPAAVRLAAMAIRFYELGVHDDTELLRLILNASRELRTS